MYWQEESPANTAISDAVIDVLFALQGRTLPVDHGYTLQQAVLAHAPWLHEEPQAGIHRIHVAGSQNGWQRPDGDQPLMLSKRTKLSIRIPKSRLNALQQALEQQTLDVGGHQLTIGAGKVRLLSRETTLLARYLVSDHNLDETAFLATIADQLQAHNIKIRKALCGKPAVLFHPDGAIATRSLLLADLTQDEALTLQQLGLGAHRTLGCGLFIPHKGIGVASRSTLHSFSSET